MWINCVMKKLIMTIVVLLSFNAMAYEFDGYDYTTGTNVTINVDGFPESGEDVEIYRYGYGYSYGEVDTTSGDNVTIYEYDDGRFHDVEIDDYDE
ncbi:hypothetical protein PQC38_gp015 [Aeromonas phage BUCT695]|uniref:hypothetical protein n=1 Tax=Aeromonas phage BUCT695 TaxID=2908630 RepID=UPI0023295F92|nr:hypothetical protein PQC38_gp015 [Aeromonas phage BUCT695]UIW10491.1 hypothetical protein [Aeromonas phage BUCT695]